MNGWRLLQVFLSRLSYDEPRVYEVHVRPHPNEDLRCNCPGYRLHRCCVHVSFVIECMNDQHGYHACLMRPANLTQEIVEDAAQFRTWIYDNARVIMLDADGFQVMGGRQSASR